jgi:UDP-N-acetylglucosamine 4,6-dehydratase/5-epimerase
MISLDKGVELVWKAFDDMQGGEIYVKKIPSIKITDIAQVIAPKSKFKITGIRPGEKLHEQMISTEDSYYTYEYSNYFKILPQINNWDKDKNRIKRGVKVENDFVYSSDNNSEWMSKADLKKWISQKYNILKN